MPLGNVFLRLVVNTSPENASSRAIYRPRSEQFVEYLAHCSKLHEKEKEQRDSEHSGDRAKHEDDPDQRDRIAEGIRNIERFERRYRTRR